MSEKESCKTSLVTGFEVGAEFPPEKGVEFTHWPPDWWKCLRFGPVSGLYAGEMTKPSPGQYLLNLRVDIDPRYPNSPVMDKVSGDFYRVFTFYWPGLPKPIKFYLYQSSWIVDTPQVTWSKCQVEITGSVSYWKGPGVRSAVNIKIPWDTFKPAGPAEVTFSPGAWPLPTYVCKRISDCFRELQLEVDVCQSINSDPILPNYNTHAHSDRPSDLPERTLTMEKAYREAGICVSITPEHTEIDDSAGEFDRWSVSELHDAMETHFSRYSGGWPKWHMWGLMAGTFDSLGVAGIMYDAAAVYGGAGEAPDRQGFAVFRNHPWFDNLAAGAPANQTQAWAMRQFLFTWVHEAGHAFNFLHSWNKGRPNALSWMNYPQNVTDFWDDFRFQFDNEELIHIRHGDRASVIMGGDPWASGGHMEAPPEAMVNLEGQAPVEMLLRSKGYFEFMEPVIIEIRIKNLLDDLPLSLDTRLNPEYGCTALYIRRPDGRMVEYAPIFCKIGTPDTRTLMPAKGSLEGEDRHSENVPLSYGTYGFYFDIPGEYLVRAVYRGPGNMLIPSNVHRVRIGTPLTKDEDRMAQDFFSREVGLCLSFEGSKSPALVKGMDLLESVVDRFKGTHLGVQAAILMAKSTSRPFFRIEDPAKNVLVKTYSPDPKKALAYTDPAVDLFKSLEDKKLNISYHQLVRDRVGYLMAIDKKAEAKKEVSELRKNLANRGVNKPVLDQIKTFGDNL
jgi:hypothetical protein